MDRQTRIESATICPDFLVEHEDGSKSIIEVKNPVLIDSDAVQRKRKACRDLVQETWDDVSDLHHRVRA